MSRGPLSGIHVIVAGAGLAGLAAAHALAHERDVDAVVVYSDVWRSNDARYLSNYMPYWNRAFVVAPRGEKPILLCALSPRVYPWIRTVTVHETIVASPNPAASLLKLCAERGWSRIGSVDLDGLPVDLHSTLTAGNVELLDFPRNELRPAPTDVEVRMHARAAAMARKALDEELPAARNRMTDHELTGRLELRLRSAGAEDVVVLVSNGEGPPAPARGAAVGPSTSVVVAVEHNGHWAKVARNAAGATADRSTHTGVTELRELLSGPCSWEVLDDTTKPAVVARLFEIDAGGRRLHFGETCLQGSEGLRVL